MQGLFVFFKYACRGLLLSAINRFHFPGVQIHKGVPSTNISEQSAQCALFPLHLHSTPTPPTTPSTPPPPHPSQMGGSFSSRGREGRCWTGTHPAAKFLRSSLSNYSSSFEYIPASSGETKMGKVKVCVKRSYMVVTSLMAVSVSFAAALDWKCEKTENRL